jgi:hypothetical protein
VLNKSKSKEITRGTENYATWDFVVYRPLLFFWCIQINLNDLDMICDRVIL